MAGPKNLPFQKTDLAHRRTTVPRATQSGPNCTYPNAEKLPAVLVRNVPSVKLFRLFGEPFNPTRITTTVCKR